MIGATADSGISSTLSEASVFQPGVCCNILDSWIYSCPIEGHNGGSLLDPEDKDRANSCRACNFALGQVDQQLVFQQRQERGAARCVLSWMV